MTDILTISNSSLSTVSRCSTAAMLHSVHRLQADTESAPLKAGGACHKALAVFYAGGTVKLAMQALRGEYKTWAEEHINPEPDPSDLVGKGQVRFCWENVSKVMRYFMEENPPSALPFTINSRMIEVEFRVPLTKDGTVELLGIMDLALVQSKTGRHRLDIVDHKTTSGVTPWFLEAFRMDSQPSCYIWAAREHTVERVSGFYVNAIELSKLPGLDKPEQKCRNPEHGGMTYEECQRWHVKTQLVYVERTDRQIKEWKRDAIRLARKLQDLRDAYPSIEDIGRVPQEGKFNYSCGRCEFKDFCFVGRPVAGINTMLVKRADVRQEKE